ncbi:E3 ubiquitin-protein ligase UBR3-like protein [Dinothrombium tinctorium]|uniref:E3 ubiquitin-protein ligase n=1 Tax=Dinothrombium tinctorium TaxID=1965070 RepID=A0A3S3Q7J7_9ACAR|nr:E3 ubiquitin-protein ligase UBR3-like protein [Dinothrombium tinctorium]RWS04950.1 E3 ubiquitin-protein ligase UBR3-like protein [Dinothrombium tinctorium]RWS05949.1 E3 ubiquitin-protein ligase UBR3-like protein [Dinothrombium tinctorium]
MSSSIVDFEGLLKKGKKVASCLIHSQCVKLNNGEECALFNQFCDYLLDPKKNISEPEIVDWLRWIISAGMTPDEFANEVKKYDTATTCGLVWTANFVAYRCRTCGISPCMSLCAECFQNGNHEGHDFNMFRSQAGGACDCGDSSVMKESGFCVRHGPKPNKEKPKPPKELLSVAKLLMPKMFFRLLVQLRRDNPECLKEVDGFITNVLNHLTEMGAAMRHLICEVLIDPKIYASLANACDSKELDVKDLLVERHQSYLLAKRKMHNFKPPSSLLQSCSVCHKDKCGIKAFDKDFIHSSFVEELLFWTIVYEFPQKLVCFLLNMLPDAFYKEAFAEAFVYHYSRISMMLARFRNGEDSNNHSSKPSPHDLLSNCVVHVSVQLFSNETLVAKLCEQQHLLHIIIASLRATIEGTEDSIDDNLGILTKSGMQDASKNKHMVVKCDHYIMKKHSYWPLVSDLNNILTHAPVANLFMSKCELLDLWLKFITAFQAMNLNEREMNQHVEYENDSYYAAFSAELEICATPMWTLISHLKDSSSAHLTKQVVLHTQRCLDDWFSLIGFTSDDIPHPYQSTFHIPLHRYYAIFMHHGVQHQGLRLQNMLPSDEAKLKLYLAHPLQVQISFYEILCGLWVRNGLQMKGQAMTYIQCHFCNSLVDPDLFLIQQCASKLNPDWFIRTTLERFLVDLKKKKHFVHFFLARFHVWDWFSFSHNTETGFRCEFLEADQVMPMLEAALTFLATIFSLRTNLGMTEEEIVRQEMVTLLAMSDRTHSQLTDLLPEKCGTSQNKEFESILKDIADYRGPSLESGGNLSQGMFSPKPKVWEEEYDPLHVLLRAVHRRDYQSSVDRYSQFVKQNNKLKDRSSQPWPPFRIPKDPDTSKFFDPRMLLYSKVLHGALFTILYKALNVCEVSDQVLSLTIFLLEMALTYPSPKETSLAPKMSGLTRTQSVVKDQKYNEWFFSDWILDNINTLIENVTVDKDRSSSRKQESTIEEMEIDRNSNDDDDDDDNYPEYMSAEEDIDSSQESPEGDREIEGAPPTPQLPSSNVRLALTGPPTTATAMVPAHNSMTLSSPVANSSVNLSPTRFNQSRPALPGPSTSPQQTNSTAMVPFLPSALFRRNQANRRRILLRRRQICDQSPKQVEMSMSDMGHNRQMLDKMLVTELIRALPASGNTLVTVPVNESLLSLLLKLHSKLSATQDSYRPDNEVSDSCIGDGSFFVKKVIDLYCKLNVSSGVKDVEDWRARLWPPKTKASSPSESSVQVGSVGSVGSAGSDTESSKSGDDRDERRRKAKERQQKLMAEFASKQKAFMKAMNESLALEKDEKPAENDGSVGSTSSISGSFLKAKTYECVICGQTTPSTVDRLVGTVVLLQSTSVLGHAQPDYSLPFANPLTNERESGRNLPCSEDETAKCQERTTLASYMEKRIEQLSQHFDPSWLNAVNIGWVGGVHVQSCGHYIHLDCHKSYLQSLRDASQQSHNRHGAEQGEFSCPLCRQMANTVLPVNPEMGHHGAVVRCRPNDLEAVAVELMNLLATPITPDPVLLKLLFNFNQDLTKATGHQYKNFHTRPTNQSLFLFMCSIARTNLEAELLVKLSKATPTGAKKSCFVSLFHCLALDVKGVISPSYAPLWSQLTGLSPPEEFSLTLAQVEVPLILRDTCALLIQIFFALPLNVDKAYYTCVVQMLFNLNTIQAFAQLTCLVTEEERIKLKSNYLGKNESKLQSVNDYMGYIVSQLESSGLYSGIDEDDQKMPNRVWTCKELIEGVKNICIPFLRIAALLQTHLYKDHFPNTIADDTENEYSILCNYLCIQGSKKSNLGSDLIFPCWIKNELSPIKTWCSEFSSFVTKATISARKLLRDKPLRWRRPALLRLPKTYDQLFLYYNCRSCKNCNKVPKEPCICLVCGTLVCMRESCCRTHNSLEACVHAEACGAGTAIYLAVNSSTIIVIRGKRACVWGSVYLDAYGEEDRDLKRGKPLYLCSKRYSVLEQQWLTHSFDHTNKRWVWHKDTL